MSPFPSPYKHPCTHTKKVIPELTNTLYIDVISANTVCTWLLGEHLLLVAVDFLVALQPDVDAVRGGAHRADVRGHKQRCASGPDETFLYHYTNINMSAVCLLCGRYNVYSVLFFDNNTVRTTLAPGYKMLVIYCIIYAAIKSVRDGANATSEAKTAYLASMLQPVISAQYS